VREILFRCWSNSFPRPETHTPSATLRSATAKRPGPENPSVIIGSTLGILNARSPQSPRSPKQRQADGLLIVSETKIIIHAGAPKAQLVEVIPLSPSVTVGSSSPSRSSTLPPLRVAGHVGEHPRRDTLTEKRGASNLADIPEQNVVEQAADMETKSQSHSPHAASKPSPQKEMASYKQQPARRDSKSPSVTGKSIPAFSDASKSVYSGLNSSFPGASRRESAWGMSNTKPAKVATDVAPRVGRQFLFERGRLQIILHPGEVTLRGNGLSNTGRRIRTSLSRDGRTISYVGGSSAMVGVQCAPPNMVNRATAETKAVLLLQK
jgi:hypothetical protein